MMGTGYAAGAPTMGGYNPGVTVGNGYANAASGGGNAQMPVQAQSNTWQTGQMNANGAQGGMNVGYANNLGTQGGYQQPQPWSNPANNPPGQGGSYFSNDNSGWNSYLGTTNANSPYQAQPGSYYSNQGQGYPGTVSDINAKTNIEPANKELEEFLEALGIYSYEYKDKNDGDGRRISPMAQEIESTPIGKVAVSQRPDGTKVVDYGKLAGTSLAALAMINNKVNKLESDFKAKILNKFNGKK
jgi:hypothetical protein